MQTLYFYHAQISLQPHVKFNWPIKDPRHSHAKVSVYIGRILDESSWFCFMVAGALSETMFVA